MLIQLRRNRRHHDNPQTVEIATYRQDSYMLAFDVTGYVIGWDFANRNPENGRGARYLILNPQNGIRRWVDENQIVAFRELAIGDNVITLPKREAA
jgi:hypothetical protein